MTATADNPLGTYLRDRRTKLDPASLGLPLARRRTPGLRREEVAQRANVSATWYTWLEQGRGGAPSASVLDRIAHALLMTDTEREHLFLLGLGHPPEVRYQTGAGVSTRLQRVLDALQPSLALIRNVTWDIVAWNDAAAATLTNYENMPPEQRNVLRLMFCNPVVRAAQPDWETTARFLVGAFRADVARAGATEQIQALVEDLIRQSPDFERFWRDHHVYDHGEGVKHMVHPVVGRIALEYSSFTVDGRPDLSLIVYHPATAHDATLIRSLLKEGAITENRVERSVVTS